MFSFLQHSSLGHKTMISLLLWASMVSIAKAELKDVFFHYMVGGMTAAEAIKDVQDAKALGVDAFALNIQSVTESWSIDAVDMLFSAANANDFKLFFSFDMNYFSSPSQFLSYLVGYFDNKAYYMHDNLPFVSTFNGGSSTFGEATPNDGWQKYYVDALASMGHTSYFIPSFSDSAQADGVNFYQTFTSVNGALSWTCWPQPSSGPAPVDTAIDEAYMAGRTSGQTYMMALSPIQFKHLDSSQNWYLSGEHNMFQRIEQVLSLQPDFLELLTWNDNGESHYMGNVWPGSMPSSYSKGYDHTGWQALIGGLIKSYKSNGDNSSLVPTNGQEIQGVFYHHTLTSDATCSSDPIGAPSGMESIQDLINIGLYASSTATNLTMRAWSNGILVGRELVVTGFNYWTVPMNTGPQYVEVVDSALNVLFRGLGPMHVTSSSTVCNYNYQVVEITAPEGSKKRDMAEASSRRKRNRALAAS